MLTVWPTFSDPLKLVNNTLSEAMFLQKIGPINIKFHSANFYEKNKIENAEFIEPLFSRTDCLNTDFCSLDKSRGSTAQAPVV